MLGRVAFAGLLLIAGAAGATWLDGPPKNWNTAGMALPKAPAPEADGALLARCRGDARPPVSAADRAVVAAGWTLVGPLQVFGDTSLLLASADVDGMCRPLRLQGFVFVGDRLAGTLSPELMDSRSDGCVTEWRLYSATGVRADFARYKESDPLCCPSGTAGVTYEIAGGSAAPLLAPVAAQ